MTVYVALKPFTTFEADELGGRLHEIVTAPENRRLTTDFPAIKKIYGNPKTAVETVRTRQNDMRKEPDYAALAVMIGTTKHSARIYGTTSMLAAPVPSTGEPGVNLAAWLDANRGAELLGVGRELLRARLLLLLDNKNFTGKVWTVIRPDNRGSMSVWTQGGYPMELLQAGKPRSYKDVDGVSTPRQLFISAKTLEEARR
jgi:hypothetical protein